MAVVYFVYILFHYQGIAGIHTDVQNHGYPAIMDSDFSHINHFPNPFLQHSVSLLSIQQWSRYYFCFFRKLHHVVVTDRDVVEDSRASDNFQSSVPLHKLGGSSLGNSQIPKIVDLIVASDGTIIHSDVDLLIF
jgi:hypothetical protein